MFIVDDSSYRTTYPLSDIVGHRCQARRVPPRAHSGAVTSGFGKLEDPRVVKNKTMPESHEVLSQAVAPINILLPSHRISQISPLIRDIVLFVPFDNISPSHPETWRKEVMVGYQHPRFAYNWLLRFYLQTPTSKYTRETMEHRSM